MSKLGKIALIGSGELTPSMVEVHKYLVADQTERRKSVFLDTPAGFQPNADDISRKAQQYFHDNVQRELIVGSCKSMETLSAYDLQLLLQLFSETGFLLVGPGSPTYLLRQMSDSSLLSAMVEIAKTGGSLAIASAAALTAGSHTLPVYEIYKVGEPLHWKTGLNILSHFGIDLVVIPHWDNGEGGTHDTRFCYMGWERFEQLRKLLPADTAYLGIDEHTACVLDFQSGHCEIRGQGGIEILQDQQHVHFAKGERFSLDLFRNGLGTGGQTSARSTRDAEEPLVEEKLPGFWEQIHELENRITVGLEQKNFRETIDGILDFDLQLSQAAAQYESEENISQARERYREHVVRLGLELEQMNGHLTRHHMPLLEALVDLRSQCKKSGHYPFADRIRELCRNVGIQLDDTPDGTRFQFRRENSQ